MRYWTAVLARRCEKCRAHEARRHLLVDPGPGQPVTVLGWFCTSCAKVELNEYELGRKAYGEPPAGDAVDPVATS